MKKYVTNFHPRMVGLTGTPEQVAVAVKAYRVYAEKIFEEGWGVEGYFVYHSDIVYFMGPDGKHLDQFASGTTPKVMAVRMQSHMRAKP
jgi:protein SCO1/2